MTPSMDFEMETNISVSNRCRVVGIEGENHRVRLWLKLLLSSLTSSPLLPKQPRMSPGTALPGYFQHHLPLQHLWRHLGLGGPSKGEKWGYKVPFSACSHFSAVVSHPSLPPPSAWDSRSLCIVLPFNCLYRPFQACPTLIFPGSECNATDLSEFPHHTPLHAFFSQFFSHYS